jgi:ureidoacrylate peracid hydrolase
MRNRQIYATSQDGGIQLASSADQGRVLSAGEWGTELVADLKPYMQEDDIHVKKVRMSGFYGTHLDQVLRTQGINTLYFNTRNCWGFTTTTEHFANAQPFKG